MTVLVPTSEQSKVVWLAERVTPQTSLDPSSSSPAVMLASPFPSRVRVRAVTHTASGAVSSLGVTSVVHIETSPTSSVTVRTTSTTSFTSPQLRSVGLMLRVTEPQRSSDPSSI